MDLESELPWDAGSSDSSWEPEDTDEEMGELVSDSSEEEEPDEEGEMQTESETVVGEGGEGGQNSSKEQSPSPKPRMPCLWAGESPDVHPRGVAPCMTV